MNYSRRCSALFVFILVGLAVVFPAYGAEFVEYESGICQFKLSGCEISPQIESAIIFGTTKILETYKKTFNFKYHNNYKVKVVIFGTKEQFHAYQKQQIGEVISETGYFSGSQQETVVWQYPDVKKMIGVIFHEVSHMMLTEKIPYCPNWLSEGLSEYFEGLNVIGSNKRVYLQQARHDWVKLWLRTGFPMEPRDYLALSHEQWVEFRKKDPNASYTIGYSLVYFMMSSNRTERVLKEVLWDIKRDYRRSNSVMIVDSNYPGGYKAFERHWKKWIPHARKYRPLRSLRRNDKLPKIPDRKK